MEPFESKTFDCGCVVTLESDDTDPARTTDVFGHERCNVHSQDATNPGPIQDFIASFKPKVPVAPLAKFTDAEREADRKRSLPKPVSRKNQERRDYYAAHKSDYGKYELARLKRMLSIEKDPAAVERLKKRLEKRENAVLLAAIVIHPEGRA